MSPEAPVSPSGLSVSLNRSQCVVKIWGATASSTKTATGERGIWTGPIRVGLGVSGRGDWSRPGRLAPPIN